jgi:soluble lytic murein transglycosylase-like protein
MSGENLKIQSQIVPLAPRSFEKTTDKTRGQKTFELDEKRSRIEGRDDFGRKETDDFRPTTTPDEKWLRERTVEELKTLVKAIQLGVSDPWQLTDLIFYARHPELKGVPLTAEHQDLLDEWNSISALLVHPTLNEIKDIIGAEQLNGLIDDRKDLSAAFETASRFKINAGNLDGYTTRYDDIIARAVEWCPGLSPAILKSLLAQESRFNPTVINQYGYAGIAQFGRPAAREVGLNVGIAGSSSDERLDPAKAIPGAARLLNIKAKRLGEIAFSRYGQPDGIEFWKFVTAAYNGGEGTVALAMGHAYRTGLAQARAQGLVGVEAVSFARRYASKWENLKIGGTNSPLGLAAARYFPHLAVQKYHEIGNYPTQIVARVAGKIK